MLTVDRVVFDAILIEPVGTEDGEESAGGAIRRSDRARSVAWWLIDHKVQGTRRCLRREYIDSLESPVENGGIVEKQSAGRGEVGGVDA